MDYLPFGEKLKKHNDKDTSLKGTFIERQSVLVHSVTSALIPDNIVLPLSSIPLFVIDVAFLLCVQVCVCVSVSVFAERENKRKNNEWGR